MCRKSLVLVLLGLGLMSSFALIASDHGKRDSETLISQAIMPLPPALKAGATVVSVGENDQRTILRKGSNNMMCRADDPAPGFMVICYHKDLDTYWTLAAPVLADGASPKEERDYLLTAVKEGKLSPVRGGILYVLNGTYVENALPMSVIFIPNLTAETSGLSNVPNQHQPWLMWGGTPLSHVMIPGK